MPSGTTAVTTPVAGLSVVTTVTVAVTFPLVSVVTSLSLGGGVGGVGVVGGVPPPLLGMEFTVKVTSAVSLKVSLPISAVAVIVAVCVPAESPVLGAIVHSGSFPLITKSSPVTVGYWIVPLVLVMLIFCAGTAP